MIKVNLTEKIKQVFKEEQMYRKAFFLLHNYVFSGVVVATKKHTIQDADSKEGLRINRSAFTGNIVLHSNRKFITNPLHISQEILRMQKLEVAKYKTIDEFIPEFLIRLQKGEEIKINWVYPGSISVEMQKIIDVYNSYRENNPVGKGSICFSHDQISFNLLDSKSVLASVASILKNIDIQNINIQGEMTPVAIKSSIDYLLACGYTESETFAILQLVKDLLPECKDCKPRSLTDFVLSVLNEYISEDGFLRNSDKFVSKINHTAGGLGVIEWSKQILSELASGIYNFDEEQTLSETAIKKISQKFLNFMRSKFKSPRLMSENDIEDFIVNNGVAFQEYLANDNNVKVEKSINFIQVKLFSEKLSCWEFFPVIISDQIIIDGMHVGNIIRLHDQNYLSMKKMFYGTNIQDRLHLIGAAYSTLVYLILSIVPCKINNAFLVNTLSDFNSIPILYSGIDLMVKFAPNGLKEVKIVEINPRFTGCIQALARVMQESKQRNVSFDDITKEKSIVSLTFYFNPTKVCSNLLKSKAARKLFAKKLMIYLQKNLGELDFMLISYQMDLISSRISYCYLIDSSISKNEVVENLHRQQELIFNFIP
ncbi:hypothetical protein I8752_28415 [Nostocaceae cyanobacterium CENA369]|uniref:Uncharacterized protein n=1 Tax=Dendronalium phyllosphericum CENA369 TaxID=1725256 RepID=A0A8J7I9W6_9NOST|nr:hypothetical protein [Dendronalium phyllosphericum]MBH8576843.1 hypothetical protein [Dendronalium phyllosphericum CENA369]